MPAGSEPVSLPRTWRPLGVRLAVSFFGTMLLTLCLFAWFGFDQETRDEFTPFQRGTIVFFVLLAFACGHALARSRVRATTDHLLVVNGYRSRRYQWAEVVSVNLPQGAPWAVIDLADGTTTPAMGIQGSDGARARRAARELRTLADRPHT